MTHTSENVLQSTEYTDADCVDCSACTTARLAILGPTKFGRALCTSCAGATCRWCACGRSTCPTCTLLMDDVLVSGLTHSRAPAPNRLVGMLQGFYLRCNGLRTHTLVTPLHPRHTHTMVTPMHPSDTHAHTLVTFQSHLCMTVSTVSLPVSSTLA